MNSSINRTQVNLEGLLEVLGKNLYSTPSVVLRELIQNSHDACRRHAIESDTSQEYRIELHGDLQHNLLIVRDNGSGLTKAEIEEFLATIGSGYTRVLRDSTQSDEMIGYFGLGFLSIYVVAEKVEVITTSFKQPDQTWMFSSAGGKSYSISSTNKQEIGTEVRLHLKKDFSNLAHEEVLSNLVQRYCCLLPIKIWVQGNKEPLNAIQVPWLKNDIPTVRKRDIALTFAKIFESDFEPIACLEIPSDNPYGLKGLIWIQSGGSYASSDNRNVSIFIRNMFITNEDRDLLPRWAGFFGAVLESVSFKPTASRESLQRDEYYHEVAAYITDFLATSLRDIVIKEPETWRRIVTRHNQALLGASIQDDRLFETMHKTLMVPTSQGEMTIPSLLKKTKGTIYIKPETSSGYEEIMLRAQGYPVVSGYLFAAASFCQRYANNNNLECHTFGTHDDEKRLFDVVTSNNDQLLEILRQRFEDELVQVVLAKFYPQHIPMVFMVNREAQIKQRIEQDEADKRIGTAALSLARLHTAKIKKDKIKKLYVNVHNPIISLLTTLPNEKADHLCILLRSFMEGYAGTSMGEHGDIAKTFEEFNRAVIAIVKGG